jgi:hypothetical protein
MMGIKKGKKRKACVDSDGAVDRGVDAKGFVIGQVRGYF